MAVLVNNNFEITGVFPAIFNNSKTYFNLNNVFGYIYANYPSELVLLNSHCIESNNKYYTINDTTIKKAKFILDSNSKISVINYTEDYCEISDQHENTNNISNSELNFPPTYTDYSYTNDINGTVITDIPKYTNGNSIYFPYSNTINVTVYNINDNTLSTIKYSDLSWHKRLINNGSVFNYYGQTINDIIFDYPIKSYNVNLDCSLGESTLNNILSYIPKDLHQTELNINIFPITRTTTNNPKINIQNFYNGKINIYSSEYTNSISKFIDDSTFYSYFYLNIENCDNVNIYNVCNIYNGKQILTNSNAPLFTFKNIKSCILTSSVIDLDMYSNHDTEYNNWNTFTYKENEIKQHIKYNTLYSLGTLIYAENSNILFDYNNIGYKYNSNISNSCESYVSIIADKNSKFISNHNNFYYKYTNLNKRKILFYSLNNSIIDSGDTDIIDFILNNNTELSSIVRKYEYYKYTVDNSIINGYASPGSFFNHAHYTHFLSKEQADKKNKINGDLPIGTIYSTATNFLSSFPENIENKWTSKKEFNVLGNIICDTSDSNQKIMKCGISYPKTSTFKEGNIYNITADITNFDTSAIMPYDYIFPYNNLESRLSSKLSENIFYFQKYYTILSESEFITPVNNKSFNDLDSDITSILSNTAQNIFVTSQIYKNFIPSALSNDIEMITKYSADTFMNKEKLILKNKNKIRYYINNK